MILPEKERKKYRKCFQSGSDALHFGKCADDKQFWLPLLEKAYAKVHGDYEAIDGGFASEAIEDLTGGVSTYIMTSSVRDREVLWNELLNKDGNYLFAANSFVPSSKHLVGRRNHQTRGLAPSHSYAVEGAIEVEGEHGVGAVRLVRMRNPWGSKDPRGCGVWDGA